MKLVVAMFGALLLAILPIIPAYAITYSIDQIEAYQHVVEPNDQMYMFKYTDSAVADNLTFSLYSSNSTLLATTTPYVYHTQGIAVAYFPAASAPIWLNAISVNMTGAFGSTVSSTVSSWSTSTTVYDTSVALTIRVLYLAGIFSTAWPATLTKTDGNGIVTLSDTGETYFVNTLPNLKNVCPALFATVINQPVPQIRTQNTTAATASDARLVGTPFDTTGIANFLGTSRMWANAIVWCGFWLCLDAALIWKMKATRIALFVFGFAMIGGAITGFMGMLAGVLVGLLGGISLVFAFMWKGAT